MPQSYTQVGENYLPAPLIRLMNNARTWVRNLDREPLGFYAVDENLLAAVYAWQYVSAKDDEQYPLLPHFSNKYSAEYRYIYGKAKENDIWDAVFELFFWVHKTDDYSLTASGQERTPIDMKASGIFRVTRVYENPHLHSFFEADIWDMKFIERCIADDIDATMALQLKSSDRQ